MHVAVCPPIASNEYDWDSITPDYLLDREWIASPVGDSEMIRYNPFFFYWFHGLLEPIRKLNDKQPRGEVWGLLKIIENRLSELADAQFIKFDEGTCRAATDMAEILRSTRYEKDDAGAKIPLSEPFDFMVLDEITKALQRFEIVFRENCASLDLFWVPDVLAYSTKALIERGEDLIPLELRSLLTPLLKDDLRSAARCLAFDLPTACAFHLARAIEGVMGLYHVTFLGSLPKHPSMGALHALWQKDETVPELLIANVKYIKDNYRNPVSHPEISISTTEIHAMVGIYIAAITDMLSQIAARH